MRRTRLAFLTFVAVGGGCAQMSVGVWSDSDRGAASIASISSIEFPAEPVMQKHSNDKVAKPVAAVSDPSPPKPIVAVASKISDAQKTKESTSVASTPETWTPRVADGANAAEQAYDVQNYRWVQGRVSFVKISGERVWKIRFAPYHQEDRYGGSFVLDGSMPPNLKEGDLVRVEGRPKASPSGLRVPSFHCDRLTILHRGERPTL